MFLSTVNYVLFWHINCKVVIDIKNKKNKKFVNVSLLGIDSGTDKKKKFFYLTDGSRYVFNFSTI